MNCFYAFKLSTQFRNVVIDSLHDECDEIWVKRESAEQINFYWSAIVSKYLLNVSDWRDLNFPFDDSSKNSFKALHLL